MICRTTHYIVLFTLCLFVGFSADARTKERSASLKKIKDQMFEITPALASENALPTDAEILPFTAFDRELFNPSFMVRLNYIEAEYLMGYIDQELVKPYLDEGMEPLLLPVGVDEQGKPIMKAFLMITVSKNFGYEGCSCPPYFEELMVNLLLKDPGVVPQPSLATVHVLPLYIMTNHLKRQESWVRKFSMPAQYVGMPAAPSKKPRIGMITRGGMTSGFYVKDHNGRNALTAFRKSGPTLRPTQIKKGGEDIVFYRLAEKEFKVEGKKRWDLYNLEGTKMPPRYFRLNHHDHPIAFNPLAPPPAEAFFNPQTDVFRFNKRHPLGKLLDGVGFVPSHWFSETYSDGIAWVTNIN